MITGNDIVLDSRLPGQEACNILVNISRLVWPDRVVENDEDGKTFPDCVFVYKNQEAKESWGKDGMTEENQDVMMQFICKYSGHITIVCGNRTHPDFVRFLSCVLSFKHPAIYGIAFGPEWDPERHQRYNENMLNEYGVNTFCRKWDNCYAEAMSTVRGLNREKALGMLNNLQKEDPETFRLVMLIYSLFRYDQEDPDGISDPAAIATLLINPNELINACREIKILEDNHAQHIKGWKCGFFPDEDILKYTHGEVAELEAAPDDIHEMADSLVCLFSYCIRKNWSPDQVGKAIRFKLREKFKDLDKLIEEQKNV